MGHAFLLIDASDCEVGKVWESEDEYDVELSSHAMTGDYALDTFMLIGWIGENEVNFHVDYGSLHNFTSFDVVKKMGLQGVKVTCMCKGEDHG